MRNIGPTSSHELAEICIKSPSDLIKAGIEETARRLLFRFGGEKQISVNYLYALEDAIHDHDCAILPHRANRNFAICWCGYAAKSRRIKASRLLGRDLFR
ncbi:hypothetical protein TH24_06520 [Thalassospira xiamenensis]|nr:hypothetical protein TH24_06520 [Thalassospira xiamenensis]